MLFARVAAIALLSLVAGPHLAAVTEVAGELLSHRGESGVAGPADRGRHVGSLPSSTRTASTARTGNSPVRSGTIR